MQTNYGEPRAACPQVAGSSRSLPTHIFAANGSSNPFSTNGLTLGAGMTYHFTETWALNGRVQAAPVNVYSLDFKGQGLDNQEWSGLSTRLSVGLTSSFACESAHHERTVSKPRAVSGPRRHIAGSVAFRVAS